MSIATAQEQQHEPTSHLKLPHLPALDGLRGLAVVGVVGFHAGFHWLRGGYLPLTAFFVLSGFLITSLLLLEVQRTGRIDLRAFWGRRARRLVPGALLGLTAAGLVALVTHTGTDRLQGDAVAALAWATNWRLIATGQSYSTLFSHPSPLQHYWSLAIEEQFYLVLPLLAVGLLVLLGKGRRRFFVVGITALTIASVVATRALHHPGDSPLRTYYGTDTRAAELLVGVLLAAALIGKNGLRQLPRWGRVVCDVVGLCGLGVTLTLWCTVGQFDDWLFEGGLFLIALLAGAIVLAGTQPGTVTARLLSFSPLAGLGKISYGVYVVHWPLFLLLSPERTHLAPAPLAAVRLTAVLLVAVQSYLYLEQPVRRGRLPKPVARIGWANGAVAVSALFALAATAVPTAQITLRAEGAAPPPPPPPPAEAAPAPTAELAAAPAAPPTTAAVAAAPHVAAAHPAAARSQAKPRPTPTAPPRAANPAPVVPRPTPVAAAAAPAPTRVLVFGDSIAQNMATGLLRVQKKTGSLVVWDHGVPGCAIGRGGTRRMASGQANANEPVCEWWATPQARQEIATFHPDVVLIVGGINDLYDRKLPSWPDYLQPGDPTFDSWLLSEYQAAVNVFRSSGATVVWAPPPCADWTNWSAFVADGETKRRHIESTVIAQLQASVHPAMADLDGQLCPNGTFDRDALGIKNSRPDGLHLTDDASEVLATRWLAPLLVHAVAH